MSVTDYGNEIVASPREFKRGRTVELPSDVRRRSSTAPTLWAALKYLDPILIGSVVTLTMFGLWMLYGTVQGSPFLLSLADRQVTWFGLSLAAFAVVLALDYRWLGKIAPLGYAVNLGLLVVVLLWGTTVNGATCWIRIGPVNFQPSETMKLFTVLVLAQWFAARPEGVQHFRDLIVPGIISGMPFLLIMKQPDLGTGLLFFAMTAGMIYWAGVRFRIAATVVTTGIICCLSAFPFLHNYQKERLLNFIDPHRDPLGTGYNVIQSLIAVGNGGIAGQGWGEGTQAVYRYLPEAHTDFIYASAVEQTGLLGGLAILVLYALMMWRVLHSVRVARDRFGGLVVVGLGALLLGHIWINIGMNIGLMPVTGLPLPFISYGGSFLLSSYILIGLILSISMRRFVFSKSS